MRNLKRALSLTLASVMLLGMMVVGAGAASYPDVTEENNVEAIEVLQAVEVMVGDDNGNFGPSDLVNRSQMAVVMANLLNLDYRYYEKSCPFWDVPTWARPYVGACYANGIVSGYGDGTYGAADSVTAVQAASMMMRALGYFKYSSDYKDGFETSTVRQGTRIGIFNGLSAKSDEPLTRNDVAQMALNALKTAVVEPDDNTINIVDGNGNLVASGGQVNYVVIASNESYARAINRTEYVGNGLNQVTGYTVELGEQLYNGDLKLTDDIDAFNRPARSWEYKGKSIGLYAKEELMKYENVGEVTGKDLYDLLGKTIIDDYTIEVALDGVTDPDVVYSVRGYDNDGGKKNVHYVFDKDDINRSNKGSLGATGTGVLTQVFVDPDYDNGGSRPDGRVWIAIINTYLARATQDYDSKREELALNAYSVEKSTRSSNEYVKLDKNSASVSIRLGVDEFPVVEDAKKDDAFLVTFAEGEVQTVMPAEVLSGVTVSSFKVKDNVVVDGTTYKFTTTAGWDPEALKVYTGDAIVNLKDMTYNIFLDAYGNLIGVQEVDAAKNYVFIAALDLNDSNLVNGTADAKAIFLDGTTDTIRVNMDKSTLEYYGHDVEADDEVQVDKGFNRNSILNTWCTYTKNNSNVYTLKQVTDVKAKGDDYVPTTDSKSPTKNTSDLAQYHQTAGGTEFAIDKKHITLNGNNSGTGSFARVYGNEKTVYLTAELGNLTNQGGTWGVIKGVDSVSTSIEKTNLNVWTDADAVKEAESTKVTLSGPDKTAYASKGVYTLYDDDGIVIAAVVVGEDDGTARNLVYVHSGSVEWEAYNGESSNSRASGDGLWTWTRKVISNGEEITLTEVSDGNSDLAAMQRYHWYQIKTNGNGEVTGAYQMPVLDKANKQIDDGSKLPVAKLTRLDDLALDYKPDFVKSEKGVDQGEIAYTIQHDSNNVLYWNQNYIVSQLRMNGRTLYVATDDETGFIVNTNVKWVVQQWDNNKKETYIDEGTTAAGLKNMIDELNRRNTDRNGKIEDYHYQVSAIIESGIASSVVIYYNENDYNRPGTGDDSTGTSSTDYYEFSYKSGNTGRYSGTLIAKRPAWLADTVALDASYEVWVNGDWASDETVTIGTSAKSATNIVSGVDVDSSPTVEIRNFKWTNLTAQTYNIKWSVNGTEVTPGANSKLDGATTPTVDAVTGNVICIKLNGDVYKDQQEVKWTATGLYAGSAAETGGTVTTQANTNDAGLTTAKAAKADGTALKDYVKINLTINDSALKPATYKVITDKLSADIKGAVSGSPTGVGMDKFGVRGASADGLSITISSVSGIEKGGKVTFSAALGDDASANFSYDVTIVTDVGNIELEGVKGTTSVDGDLLAITSDVEITNVVVKANPIPMIVEAKLDEGNPAKMTVTFNVAVAKASDGTTALDKTIFVATTGTVGKVETIDNKTFVLIFEASIKNGETIDVTYSTVSAKGEQTNVMKDDGTNDTTEITINTTAGTAAITQKQA